MRRAWNFLAPMPGGKWIFSRLLGRMVPYSGSLLAEVLELKPGYARLRLRDRRHLRNHLRSVHAIALANLGELTSGLAFNMGLPSDARAIVTELSIKYLAKARGNLTAECHCAIPTSAAEAQMVVEASIRNAEGIEVAHFQAHWKVGPKVKAPSN